MKVYEVNEMEFKPLAILASLLVMAAPVFAGPDQAGPSSEDIRNREARIEKLATQKVMASVQARLPQAEIANLLSQIEDISQGTGAFSAAESARIEDELARQKQFWYEEYQKALRKGADLEALEGSALEKGFDDLMNAALSPDPNEIAPEDLRVVYQEYDNLSQTFQQLKLARFLSSVRDGVPRYGKAQPNTQETAEIAAEMDAKFLPGYQKRIQEGVSNLRKILVASKAE